MAEILDGPELVARLKRTPRRHRERVLEREANKWLETETDLSAAARGECELDREVCVGLRSQLAYAEVRGAAVIA